MRKRRKRRKSGKGKDNLPSQWEPALKFSLTPSSSPSWQNNLLLLSQCCVFLFLLLLHSTSLYCSCVQVSLAALWPAWGQRWCLLLLTFLLEIRHRRVRVQYKFAVWMMKGILQLLFSMQLKVFCSRICYLAVWYPEKSCTHVSHPGIVIRMGMTEH